MTQEEKTLLLQDLCARLPYKPIVHAKWSYRETNGELKYKEADRKLEINDMYAIWDIKPYLRPMSSMTEEEKKEYKLLCDYYMDDKERKHYFNNIATMDWYHQKHFDCRGLIKLGLALEAPEEMYSMIHE